MSPETELAPAVRTPDLSWPRPSGRMSSCLHRTLRSSDLAPASRTVREAGARSTEHCLDLAVPDWNQERAFAREQLALISLASSGRTYAPVLVALDEDGNAAVRASSGRATGARGKVGPVCADTAGGPSVVSPLPGSRRGVGRIPGRVPGRGRPGPGDGPTNPGLPGTC